MILTLITEGKKDWYLFQNPDVQVYYDPSKDVDHLIIHSARNYYNQMVPSEIGMAIVKFLNNCIKNGTEAAEIDLDSLYKSYHQQEGGDE